MKKVLVLYYTQTGQQKEIADHVLQPLEEDKEVEITWCRIHPKKKFPFPWNRIEFFDVFPETFLQIPMELEPIEDSILEKEYDLIVLSYQIWFLSISLPVISCIKNPQVQKLLKNKPVLTVIGCRNMWAVAQEKMKKQLKDLQATLVGNIVFTDRQTNHVSLITLLYWLFQGKKESYLGIFPKPGVPDKDIQEAGKFGIPILEALKQNKYTHLQAELIKRKAVIVKPLLVFIEKRGTFIFSKWSKFIRKKGNPGEKSRHIWLQAFYYYLMIALWVVAPVVTLIFLLIYLPTCFLFNKSISYYQSITLKE